MVNVWHWGKKAWENVSCPEWGSAQPLNCCQKLAWKTMSRLIWAGYSDISVLNGIHQCYRRNLLMTKVIDRMKRVIRTGDPNLSLSPKN